MAQAIPLVHDVSFDVTPEHFSLDIPSFDTYVMIQQETFYDYRSQPDYRKLYIDGQQRLQDMPLNRLLRGVEMRDGPMMLELCLRRTMLCNIDGLCSRETMTLLHDLSGFIPRPDGTFAPVAKSTPRLRLRAVALAVWIVFGLFWDAPTHTLGSIHDVLNSPVLQRAVRFANLCAAAAFYPPVVLRLASWFMTVRIRHGADLRYMGQYAESDYLWKAYDEYCARRLSAEQKRLDKVARAPNRYRCAADGCGIQALHKRALRRCAGPCPPDHKPHYCSQECQRKHWFVHRYACLEDPEPVVQDDGDPDWVDVETYEPHHGDVVSSVWAESENSDIFVDITNISKYRPQEVYRLHTKTLSPALLRSYRELWDLPEPARSAKSLELLKWLAERAADMDWTV